MLDGHPRRQRRWILAGILAKVLFLSPMGLTHGASAFTLAEAEHAYRMGLFELADEAYQDLLSEGEHNAQALQRLLEIALRRGAWERAAEYLRAGELRSNTAIAYWEAQLAIGQGESKLAEAALRDFLQKNPEHELALEASLSLATLELDQGRFESAQELLDRWTRSDDVRVDYLKGRYALATGKTDEAINCFARLQQSPGSLPASWIGKVYLGLAFERLDKSPPQRESTIEILKEYLEKFSPSAEDETVFALLKQARSFSSEPQRQAWQAWIVERNASVRSQVFLALAEGQAEAGNLIAAISMLDNIGVDQPAYEEALVLRARWFLESESASACLGFIEKTAEARLASSKWRYHLLAIKGLAHYQIGTEKSLAAALSAFASVQDGTNDVSLLRLAAFNCAVLAEGSAGQELFEKSMRELLEATEPAVQNLLGGEASFLRALRLARKPGSEVLAEDALKAFLIEYPIHQRRREAHMARLELALAATPPRVSLARRIYERLVGEGNGFADDRLGYLNVCRALAAGSSQEVLASIDSFRETFSQTEFLDNVAFREAEWALRNGELSLVENHMEKADQWTEGSVRWVQARFFQAYLWSRKGDHESAVKVWGEVIDNTEGEAQLLARHELALSVFRKGDREGAVALWDAILELQPNLALRQRALMAKGECRTLQAGTDAAYGSQALALFEEVLALPNIPDLRREEALYRKGMVHLAIGEEEKALGAFDQALDGLSDEADPGRDLEWVYRAGFEAIKLAESLERFDEAAQRANELASLAGERAEEARIREGEVLRNHSDSIYKPLHPDLVRRLKK